MASLRAGDTSALEIDRRRRPALMADAIQLVGSGFPVQIAPYSGPLARTLPAATGERLIRGCLVGEVAHDLSSIHFEREADQRLTIEKIKTGRTSLLRHDCSPAP